MWIIGQRQKLLCNHIQTDNEWNPNQFKKAERFYSAKITDNLYMSETDEITEKKHIKNERLNKNQEQCWECEISKKRATGNILRHNYNNMNETMTTGPVHLGWSSVQNR